MNKRVFCPESFQFMKSMLVCRLAIHQMVAQIAFRAGTSLPRGFSGFSWEMLRCDEYSGTFFGVVCFPGINWEQPETLPGTNWLL